MSREPLARPLRETFLLSGVRCGTGLDYTRAVPRATFPRGRFVDGGKS